MNIQTHRYIPYEGVDINHFESVEEALDHIEKFKYKYDDVEIYEVKQLDIYSLMLSRNERK